MRTTLQLDDDVLATARVLGGSAGPECIAGTPNHLLILKRKPEVLRLLG